MNIYISNLSYAVNDGDLKDLFGEYGEISSAKVITDRETGRSCLLYTSDAADEH